MALELTNSIHKFNQMITNFIESHQIDSSKVESMPSLVNLIEQYKSDFVNCGDDKPMDIVNVFSGLNLLKYFFICSQKHLLVGIAKKENPKSAEDISTFQGDIVQLANLIDEFKLNKRRDTPSEINRYSIGLRERLREKNLFPSIEALSNYKGNESSYVDKIFTNALK